MSWLFKTLQSNQPDSSHRHTNSQSDPSSNLGGVKDDLSVIGATIGRQLRGVATFLAPPPTSTAADGGSCEDESSSSQTLIGIRNDLVEIGGSFKSGLSLISSNKAVSGLSKFASSLLQVEEKENDYGDDGIPGITDEVVKFVKGISLRPECWTEFPLSLHTDFDMSDAQREHALTVEHLAPSLADLRHKLQSHMSDERFWMIYFILLLPRLNGYDFELLSTPKIVEARDVLLQKLQKRRNAMEEVELDTFKDRSKSSETQEGHKPSPEKEILAESLTSSRRVEIDEQKSKQQSETDTSLDAHKISEHEEDVSFSDLEDDDTDLSGRPSSSRLAHDTRASSPTGSSDWVQLNRSETQGGQRKSGQSTAREKDSEGESSDWLNVDDFD